MRHIFRIINRKTTSDTSKAKSYVEMQAKTRIIRDVHFDSIGVRNSKKVLSTVINGDSWESNDLRESCDLQLPGVRRFVNRIKLTKKNKCQQNLTTKTMIAEDVRGRDMCVLQRKQVSEAQRNFQLWNDRCLVVNQAFLKKSNPQRF